MTIRPPVVAGQFYSETASGLLKQLKQLIDPQAKKEKIIGAIVPHAGYIYSGRVAGAVFSAMAAADTFIILGPNHTGLGKQFSLMSSGMWKTPLGDVEIDEELSKALLKNSQILEEDDLAHRREHSLEVELPFLQYLFSRTGEKIKIVPIVIGGGNLSDYQKLGKELYQAVGQAKKKIVALASSDMTHYEAQEAAESKDKKALDKILNLDEKGLLDIIDEYNITMCGSAPVAVLLSYAKEMRAHTARLIKYETSAATSGDSSSVVGYAGVIIA